MDLMVYQSSPRERQRIADLMDLVPPGLAAALDIGARDGFVSQQLPERVPAVTALDLTRPTINHPQITPVQGDATKLHFADSTFDLILCAEVLEHIQSPRLEQACSEIQRIARKYVIVGVPYRQGIRFGRTTCQICGTRNPPYAHVNSFDESRLCSLFSGLTPATIHYVDRNGNRMNVISTLLNDLAGNPWGTHSQAWACIRCGERLHQPAGIGLLARVAASTASRINALQGLLSAPRTNWIHILFSKK